MKKRLIALGLAISTAITSTFATSASALPEVSAGLTQAINDLDSYTPVEGQQRDDMLTQAEDQFYDLAQLESGETIDIDNADVKTLPNGTGYVSAPILGAARGSVIFASFSGDDLTDVIQASLHEKTATSGTVSLYHNGELTKEEFVEVEESTAPTVALRGMDWGGLNRCLSNAGIAAWAIAALSVVCGAACAVTAGTGCVLCIAAASGATGGTVGYCVGQNWK
ncbi:hypothetical protein [Corynebacterium mastitidis]|uniref:hypothetical protein n=1 Tax=Corynebacterium mastitidis TaxID=161890 RepID=UPI0012EA5D95|nr:hypothetical protein [Corynebacterium mastitidis]